MLQIGWVWLRAKSKISKDGDSERGPFAGLESLLELGEQSLTPLVFRCNSTRGGYTGYIGYIGYIFRCDSTRLVTTGRDSGEVSREEALQHHI